MAIANITTTSNTGIGPISISSGYNPYSDTVFGVPMHEWQRMSPSEQRYYSEREYMRQQHMKMGLPPDLVETKRVAPMPPLEPAFLTNTKLLLTGE